VNNRLAPADLVSAERVILHYVGVDSGLAPADLVSAERVILHYVGGE
jgi:hypothetical protein